MMFCKCVILHLKIFPYRNFKLASNLANVNSNACKLACMIISQACKTSWGLQAVEEVCSMLSKKNACKFGIGTNSDLVEHKYRQLRARRALLQLKDVPLRTRRALWLYKVNGNSTLLVLNGTSLICKNALLAL